MPLTLAQTQLLNELADLLYPFLPGNPHPFADPSVSFRGVASDLGLGDLWQGGSKTPAITEVLAGTYATDKGRFATLILEVVRRGLGYREVKNPIKRAEIDELNDLLLKLRLRIKDLHDPRFLDTLAGRPKTRNVTSPSAASPTPTVAADTLAVLRGRLREVSQLEPIRRGFAFEGFLNEVFNAFDLAPRGSFRLGGEQIDGSFHHGGLTYLVEAKWQGGVVGQGDLLLFSGKVSGKAEWSRGVHVSLSGYSREGLAAFAHGRATNIVCFDGLDLHYVLDGRIGLRELIDLKARRAAESNEAFVPIRDLRPDVI